MPFLAFVLSAFVAPYGGMPRVKSIAGKLEGTIRFEEEGVYLAETFHTIEDIKKIEFQGVDWQGLFEHATFCDYFDNRLSNGSSNKLIIEMADGKKMITRFVKLYACELADVKSIFISYYLKDKIGYLQLIDNLCISDSEGQKELKRMKGIGLSAEEELKRVNFKQ
jgi:hypothetical protein